MEKKTEKIAIVGSGFMGTKIERVLYNKGIEPSEPIIIDKSSMTECIKSEIELSANIIGKAPGIRLRQINRKKKRDKNRIGGHGSNYTPPKKKKRKK